VEVSLQSLQYLLAKFQKFYTIEDLPRVRRARLLNDDMINAIEETLRVDDELTARKLREDKGIP